MRLPGTTLILAMVLALELAPLPILAASCLLIALGALLCSATQRARYDLEQCVEEADLAAEAGRWNDALRWTARARMLAPTSTRLMLQEAYFLGSAGRVDDALSVYEEAAELVGDGDPHFHAAILLQAAGDLGRAREQAQEAAARSPGLVRELQDAGLLAGAAE